MNAKKTISVIIPCYNEEENVIPIHQAVRDVFRCQLSSYQYEIIMIDNKSTDTTAEKIREICRNDIHTKAILNCKNFGQFNSPYYAITQSTGECAILMAADFQDPVEMIPVFVRHWEEGYQIVCGIKTTSKENPIIYKLRGMYYKLIKKLSSVDQIEHFTGFGLYDRSFVSILCNLNDPTPFLRGIVAELGGRRMEVPYAQPKRRAGKTHNNFYSLYDAAMLSFTSYTKVGLRIVTFFGFAVALLSFLVALFYLVYKLLNWQNFNLGLAPVTIGVFLMGGLQLAAMGFMGEYIMSMNQRIIHRPLVIEEERINFDNDLCEPSNEVPAKAKGA